MFEALRNKLACKRPLEQVSRLDRNLREDIGMGHVDNPAGRDPILMLTRGPFDRYSV